MSVKEIIALSFEYGISSLWNVRDLLLIRTLTFEIAYHFIGTRSSFILVSKNSNNLVQREFKIFPEIVLIIYG